MPQRQKSKPSLWVFFHLCNFFCDMSCLESIIWYILLRAGFVQFICHDLNDSKIILHVSSSECRFAHCMFQLKVHEAQPIESGTREEKSSCPDKNLDQSSAETCGGALARRGSGRSSLHIGLPEFARSLRGILPLVCQNCLLPANFSLSCNTTALMWAPPSKRKKKNVPTKPHRFSIFFL